ncbi:unnamed protein product [Rotaria sp. Silwood1]|nr:unnamed protein product [Rotaria sp. Silwood1]CAF1648803.1 unnamed protein product [Rotaria sp. Silwood1]
MSSHVKKKREDYDRKYYQKSQYKRFKSELFNSEYIRKQNARQQKCRRLKAEAQQTSINTTESTTATAEVPSDAAKSITATAQSPSTVRTNLRRTEGIRRRRAYTRKMKNENEKLSNEINILRKQNLKLKKALSQQHSEDIEKDYETPTVSPTKLFLKNVSPRAKKRATKRLIDKKQQLPRGSVSKFRLKLGINLSNDYSSQSDISSTLQKDIEEFLCQDDVTKQAPDKKKHVNGKQIRYSLD